MSAKINEQIIWVIQIYHVRISTFMNVSQPISLSRLWSGSPGEDGLAKNHLHLTQLLILTTDWFALNPLIAFQMAVFLFHENSF